MVVLSLRFMRRFALCSQVLNSSLVETNRFDFILYGLEALLTDL